MISQGIDPRPTSPASSASSPCAASEGAPESADAVSQHDKISNQQIEYALRALDILYPVLHESS
eukprot:5607724-Pyramimonas_sp.AAC.1